MQRREAAYSWIGSKKHGIDFFEAATVFDDPNAVSAYDDEHSHDEDRFVIIGMSENMRMLIVCHCFRVNGNFIRIISPRKAKKMETMLYGGA
ncbi:MAG: BrnT family toxin [Defluviitaleaceae bacterium]|nr:BrnT family toxin [Defluviitaleaceae bacterium]